MTFWKAAPTTVFCMALMGATFPPSARADEWNRRTVVTFSDPVEIPGIHLAGWAVLPAGTYLFKILDSQSDRHIVQIFSQDELTVYATILAIPNYRLKATDKTVITLRERPAGEPAALRAWFYPGRNWGGEFVYPKARAVALAATNKTPVLFTPADIPLEVAAPITSADVTTVVQLKQAPVLAIQPSGQELEVAQVVTPPPDLATVAELPEQTLPKTASPFPLIGLFGLLALAGAFALRSVGSRVR